MGGEGVLQVGGESAVDVVSEDREAGGRFLRVVEGGGFAAEEGEDEGGYFADV